MGDSYELEQLIAWGSRSHAERREWMRTLAEIRTLPEG